MREEGFDRFDFILAINKSHYQLLQRLYTNGQRHGLLMFLNLALALETRDVPDPYYGGLDGFE